VKTTRTNRPGPKEFTYMVYRVEGESRTPVGTASAASALQAVDRWWSEAHGAAPLPPDERAQYVAVRYHTD
jgi:hypothetical protein